MKQYIADFEDIIDDLDDENATQYFDEFSSISSVIDDAKLIEFESNELFLMSLDELQNIEFVNNSIVISSLANSFINSLANKAFEHRLILKNIINVFVNESFDFIYISIIESRYDDREFKEILMNCDAAKRSTVDIEQFTAFIGKSGFGRPLAFVTFAVLRCICFFSAATAQVLSEWNVFAAF